MKTIPLTQGKFALVDDCDYEYLSQWKWHFTLCKGRRTGYAKRRQIVDGKIKLLPMHHAIADRVGLKTGRSKVDHRDENGLNNSRDNLRVATNSQNLANRPKTRYNTSGFKGMTFHQGKWHTQIVVNGQHHYLGRFADKVTAAKKYNEAAVKHFGEFARLNPV